MAEAIDPKKLKEFQEAFAKYDEEGSGEISEKDLGNVLRLLGKDLEPS
eukprot:CAMPEP_0117055438 /NCGR_PEP_ID=MMETSP0472-20121206/38434_1 /TAXON_ID=693140 ORGANISM="Tiarina fusus, Strain LIS" /NCGR_SAMPLE_ID=MMETSP0472 /ASSEMBLY_ACC=CAM_ASM_000603 /LENGTH=47 /DNA_ID= /DNA_START= /DNA_END= /DNA_ORIENTATION=